MTTISRYYYIEKGKVREGSTTTSRKSFDSIERTEKVVWGGTTESKAEEGFQANGHLNAFLAFAFDHTSHGDSRHPQDRFPFGKR